MLRVPGADDPHADAAAALHDVSNALTIILGWASEARSADAAPGLVQHALQIIEDQARIARSLARGAIGAGTVSDLEQSLDAIVGSAVSALSIQAAHAGVALVTETSGPLVSVPQSDDVRQVVTNLVMNALAFAPRGSKVKVALEESPGAAIVVVEDEGPGVPPERGDEIFRGESTRAGGAGIGLRHARSLARAAGGDLELLPSAAGARFRLTWPRARSRSLAPPPPSKSVAVLEGTRVLVVEDDEHVTVLLEAALGARGAVVTVARDRAELAQALAEGEHDAALIDLSPIATDVGGAVAALRKRSPHAALVFISGSSIGLPDALASEDVVWVRKPFEVSEIVSAVLKKVPPRRG